MNLSPFISNNQFENYNLSIVLFIIFIGLIIGMITYNFSHNLVKGNKYFNPLKCNNCKNRIHLLSFIPLTSNLFTFGRCKNCKQALDKKIIFEITTPLFFIFSYYYFELTEALFYSALFIFLSILFYTDLTKLELHMPTILVIAICGFLYNFLDINDLTEVFQTVILGFFVGFGVIFFINKIYFFIRKRNGFGEGDKWFLGSIGIWLGHFDVLLVFIYSCWLATIFGFFLYSKKKLSSKIPFGCFISISAIITLI